MHPMGSEKRKEQNSPVFGEITLKRPQPAEAYELTGGKLSPPLPEPI